MAQQLGEQQLQLKNKQQELDAFPGMSPEVKELAEEMSRNRLLSHEILAHFIRFKSGEKE